MKTIIISVVCFVLGGLAGGFIINTVNNSAAAEEKLQDNVVVQLPAEKNLPPEKDPREVLAAARAAEEKEKPITVARACYVVEQNGFLFQKKSFVLGTINYSYKKEISPFVLTSDIIADPGNQKLPLSISFGLAGPFDFPQKLYKNMDKALVGHMKPIQDLSGHFNEAFMRALKSMIKATDPGVPRNNATATTKNGWQITITEYTTGNPKAKIINYQLVQIVKI